MGDKEDPDRLIFEFSTHIAVPKWQPKTAYKECFHCRESFSGGHQHNCRLCGELFCSECTGKYCLPSMFAGPKKHKADEAVRVCYGCKMSCMQEKKRREEEKKGVNINSIPKSKRNVAEEKVMYPPVWKDLVGYTACVKCNKKGGKPHNCRGCGDLFCEKCTSKLMVPPAFEKKDKKGPARVCDECRYKIKGGWRMLESKQDEKKVIVDDDIPLPDDAPPEDGIAITVKKENEVASLGKVTVRETATLVEIDVKFKKSAPAGLRYDYLCRGQIVHKVFWDIFTARIIGNVLYIRPEPSHEEIRRRQQAEASVAAGMGAMAMGMMPVPMAVEAVSSVNNPFKAKEEKKKAPEPVKPMVVFKKPGKVKKTRSVDFAQLSRVATSGPPPTGLGSGAPTGPSFIEKTPEEKKAAAPVPTAAAPLVGDPFKARAALFKAM